MEQDSQTVLPNFNSANFIFPTSLFLVAAVTSLLRPDFFPTFLGSILSPFISGGPVFRSSLYSYIILLAPSLFAVPAVIISYLIGKRVDFGARHLRLVAISLVGSFVGNLPGFYSSISNPPGIGWEFGFGYVRSFGLPEPSSILNLLAATVASFMVPTAGLALAHFRRMRSSRLEGKPEEAKSRRFWRKVILVDGLIIAAAAFPVSDLLNLFINRAFPTSFQPFDPWTGLISGHVGFLIYPVLLLITFYLLGNRIDIGDANLFTLGAYIFAAGAAGLLVGDLASRYFESPGTFFRVFDPSAISRLTLFLFTNGILFAFLGFGSASLGSVRGLEYRAAQSGSSALSNTEVAPNLCVSR